MQISAMKPRVGESLVADSTDDIVTIGGKTKNETSSANATSHDIGGGILLKGSSVDNVDDGSPRASHVADLTSSMGKGDANSRKDLEKGEDKLDLG